MPTPLTTGAQVACAHQGSVVLSAGQSKLTVNGQPVLIQGDLVGAVVGGCTTPTDSSGNKTCLATSSASGGVAQKLTVNGVGVLTDGHSGQTDGTVGGSLQSWSVRDAGQTKLTAQ